ncbi:TraB/GumN family protein [Sphingobium boeckii]|uniref:TraB/GumN family protein n=1 Tax=Sphingobium boeckii TaxID=1082345 RepID=A0A7W9AKE4_9SPHN|nr:TraB/GumN family protein [Sphingobium boeckii]MBB5687054.1 hypothetical protein [Sphingobium boeckii]
MIRFIRKALAALAALPLVASCSAAEVAVSEAKPALWKVADADTTIYLFGTIHVLPKDYQWRTRPFEAALATADSLVLEIVVDGAEAQDPKTMQALATSPGLPPLLDRVPAAERPALSDLVASSKIPMASLDRMETWAASLALASNMVADLNLSPNNGVERQLTATFRAANKPISGLETVTQQLGYFDTLPEATQRAFLSSVVNSNKDASAEFTQMIAAWASGDTQRIAATFDDEMKASPELADVLLTKRNANWASWVKQRLATPGTVMVAVGAGHLVGADSVQAMLAKDGLKVTRVQ